MGREWGGKERRWETVDFPVAREPVRPIRIMVGGGVVVVVVRRVGWGGEMGRRDGWRLYRNTSMLCRQLIGLNNFVGLEMLMFWI